MSQMQHRRRAGFWGVGFTSNETAQVRALSMLPRRFHHNITDRTWDVRERLNVTPSHKNQWSAQCIIWERAQCRTFSIVFEYLLSLRSVPLKALHAVMAAVKAATSAVHSSICTKFMVSKQAVHALQWTHALNLRGPDFKCTGGFAWPRITLERFLSNVFLINQISFLAHNVRRQFKCGH